MNKIFQFSEYIKLGKIFNQCTAYRISIEYLDKGIKLTIKFVDADAIIIKIKAKTITNKLLSLPIISVGLVNILDRFSEPSFKKASMPDTINKAKNEN